MQGLWSIAGLVIYGLGAYLVLTWATTQLAISPPEWDTWCRLAAFLGGLLFVRTGWLCLRSPGQVP